MRLKEKREKKNQLNRLIAAVLLLVLLLAASFYAIFNKDLVKLNLPNFQFKEREFIRPNTTSNIQELTDKLLEANLSVDFPLVATEGAIKGRLIGGGELWFSGAQDAKSQVEALQTIVSRLTIEGKKIKKIDLRYNRPIVVY